MKFSELNEDFKKKLHLELKANADSIGGINFLLSLKEDLKKEKPHALLNKTSIYHFSKGKVTWNKQLYKDTLDLLLETMKNEENSDYSIKDLKAKKQKNIVNMKKALSPVTINVQGKDVEEEGFSFKIIDRIDDNNMKISFMFKIFFLYNVTFLKDILAYKVKKDD